MNMMDSAMDFCEGISQIAQRRQKYSDAWRAQIPVCGSCQHWMKRPTCPRERGVMIGGPTSGTPACEKFSGTAAFQQDVAAFAAMPRPQ